MESSILPRYFNHSSFASLRRQLNYFSFTRIGKGRQRGATYCNEGVIELEDILSLTRRSVTSAGKGVEGKQQSSRLPSLKQEKPEEEPLQKPNKRFRSIEDNSNTVVHQTPCSANSVLPARVSPVDSLVNEKQQPAPKRISLDLTGVTESPESTRSLASVTIMPAKEHPSLPFQVDEDKDILDGCRALLCFSRGIVSN